MLYSPSIFTALLLLLRAMVEIWNAAHKPMLWALGSQLGRLFRSLASRAEMGLGLAGGLRLLELTPWKSCPTLQIAVHPPVLSSPWMWADPSCSVDGTFRSQHAFLPLRMGTSWTQEPKQTFKLFLSHILFTVTRAITNTLCLIHKLCHCTRETVWIGLASCLIQDLSHVS